MTQASPKVQNQPTANLESSNSNASEESQYRPIDLLNLQSYTAHRLKHASPEHLHLTTRRCFVGPIPEGWLKDHRRDWYKHHLHIHYASRAASFSATPNTGQQRRVTGIDGDRNIPIRPSFPQPSSVVNDHFDSEQEEASRPDKDVVIQESPAIEMPRTSEAEASSSKVDLTQEEAADKTSSNPTNKVSTKPGVSLKLPEDVIKRQTSGLSRPRLAKTKSGTSSFVTARESLDSTPVGSVEQRAVSDASTKFANSREPNRDSVAEASSVGGSSTAPLVKDAQKQQDHSELSPPEAPKSILNKMRPRSQRKNQAETNPSQEQPDVRTASGLVRFNVPDEEMNDAQKGQMVKVRLAQYRRRDTLKRLRKGKIQDGEILKWEKMLVRVEFTAQELQDEFDENDSQKIDSRTLGKWREYIVVCRESTSEEEEFMLQFYDTRVIHAVEKTSSKKRAVHQVSLHSKTNINIFSSLDKTIVLWDRYKTGRRIFIMKPRSGANSMEWFTFVRNLIGWHRSSLLQVNVPDLEVSLRIEDPFENLESSDNIAKAAQGDEEALAQAVEEESAAAGKIVLRCMTMLENSPDLGSIVDAWAISPLHDSQALSTTVTENDSPGTAVTDQDLFNSVGLAWKRYDRLEWVHGANERSMYGTIGMEKSHDLELRPKQHYPTSIINANGKTIVEPSPVEGFLIRLTSQKGAAKRFGRLFFKRLYFSTHNQYLVFNRPAQADPPPPPKLPMREDNKVPSAKKIAESVPLIYAVNPYPIKDGKIQWLSEDSTATSEDIVKHDEDAYDENERTINLLIKCDGVINLCSVVRVRKMRHGATPADDNMDEGSEVDFHEDMDDDLGEDGSIQELEEDRTFELVLNNGLVIRLQAYNKKTKQEWMRRLRKLVRYWTQRVTLDIDLYKSVRRTNLERLNINEDIEAAVGQFAKKWEVRQAYASPELYHMCGISCCRTIHISGVLYRKPRLHTSFQRCRVILTHGHLLLFEDVMRDRSGRIIPHIQHQRMTSLDLSDCYIYSGLITSNDLTYDSGSTAFDRAHYGIQQGLPRMYLGDGWSSTDEDTMTCFVIWHGKRRSWFRSEKAQGQGGAMSNVKLVGQLGKEGRAVVFKTRSRAERDHWVMNVAMEIERLSASEDVRIVED